MDFALSDLQRELAASTREVLTEHCPPAVVREAWSKPAPGSVWRALAELGLPGALVPEPVGGLGLTGTDVLPALIEVGAAAVPAPIAETTLLAVPLLTAVGGHEPLLAAVVAGEVVITGGFRTAPIPYLGSAGYAVLVGAGGVWLRGRDELAAEPLPAVDGARPLARVRADLGAPLTADPALVAASALRGALGAAAQLLGLARRQLEMTVEYVSQRHQFGVPVGSFQAVKHQLADAYLGLRFAEPAVYRAALSVDAAAPRARRDVAMAKAMAGEAAQRVARTAIQCHGAMGYSFEYDLQLYAKRTWALAAAWGTTAEHRAVYGDELGVAREGTS